MNNNNDCDFFSVKEERMCKMCERSLHLMHEDADSRMIFYLNSVTNPSNVVIQTSYTDVLVIALGGMGSMSSDIKVPFVFSLVNWYYFCKLYQVQVFDMLKDINFQPVHGCLNSAIKSWVGLCVYFYHFTANFEWI